MFSKEDLNRIKQLVKPIDILTNIGGVSLTDIIENETEIRTYCPLHSGDNKSSFCWYKSGTWVCYSKSCGINTPRDVFNFVSLKLNISFYEAVSLVAKQVGYKSDITYHPEQKKIDEHSIESLKKIHSLKKYSLEYLQELYGFIGYHKDGFSSVLKYLESRNYNYDDLKIFKLYPHLDSFGLLRLGIPVYDDFNRLVGINARLMDTVIEYPKTVIDSNGRTIIPPKYKMISFKKGSCLYNLNNAKNTSVIDGIIVVEGQLDVMRLHTYGITTAVCTMGTSLTAKQVSLLYKYAYHIIFLLEEGDAAIEGVKKSIRMLKNPMKISLAMLPNGDADSNTKETVVDTLKKAKVISMRKLENLMEI